MLIIIVVSGLPGTGKSTLAEALAKKLAYPIFSVDPIESGIIKAGFPRGFETGLAAYLVAKSLANEQLKLGQSVVIDAVSHIDEARNLWRELATTHNAQLVLLEVYCSNKKTHQDRVKQRIRKIPGLPELSWDYVEARRKEYQSWKEAVFRLDSVQQLSKNLQKALKHIARFDR